MTGCQPLIESKIYGQEELKAISTDSLPKHIAIIMDGNRRWAQKKFFSSLAGLNGHLAGAQKLVEIVEAALEIGIETLTVFAFSTENWSRPKTEIDYLFTIFENYLIDQAQKMVNQGVRFSVIGERSRIPKRLQAEITRVENLTKDGDALEFVVALNYGGRDDLVRSCKEIAKLCVDKVIDVDKINEELIGRHLDTKQFKDPDLLIRTSGEQRISNFLLWQTAYSEFFVSDALWPEFSPKDLLKAIVHYQSRQRRKGS